MRFSTAVILFISCLTIGEAHQIPKHFFDERAAAVVEEQVERAKLESRAMPDINQELPNPASIGKRKLPNIENELPNPASIGRRQIIEPKKE
ncbi:MAG: hypothetical protein M1821_001420 [Bathelium mastoideum]|nr:MAG: hypothetical protein M1821_001420 [Bathelium mastoideum]KAI9689948.1 MAG: hypothetical protein M1822_009830 [Bathelium mastoideum]